MPIKIKIKMYMQNSLKYDISSGIANMTNSEKYCKKYLSVISSAFVTKISITLSLLQTVFHKMPITPNAIIVASNTKLKQFKKFHDRLLLKISTKSFTTSNTKSGINAEKYKNKFFKNFIFKYFTICKKTIKIMVFNLNNSIILQKY